MNFMSGRSGICKEITASTGIISMSSSSSPSSSSSSLQPYINQYNNRHRREEAEVAGGLLDRDDHMVANSSTPRPTVLVMEREHMFDKVVTPSDVGKLNRLVIPKHHAEKYFPLDPTSNEKGLLLNFEDRNGKPWRFRYSYWNSSQSYVMTKGWSRFVKEKKLDAGDIVSFQRGLGDLRKDLLFIDWRHRPDAPLDHHLPPIILPSNINNIPYYNFSNYNYPMSSIHHPWNPTFSLQPSIQSSNVFSHLLSHHHHPQGSTVYDLNSGLQGDAGRRGGGTEVLIPQHLGMVEEQRRGGVVFESVPVVQGKATAKRLRLFGVNMDCPISESDHESDMMLNTTQPQYYSKRPLHLMPLPPPFDSSSSNTFPSLQLQSNYNSHADHDKGKGSTSLDLDI